MKFTLLTVLTVTFVLFGGSVVGQTQCAWTDLCTVYKCPDGMKCSQADQSCVCDNDLQYANFQSIDLLATVFDFPKNNTDFENGEPDSIGVGSKLGDDDLPVFGNSARFDYFFRYTPGVNLQANVNLTLSKNAEGKYVLDYMSYFPVDNILYGNEGNPHNYHFSTKTSWTVDYRGGEYVYLRYDDGVLLYLNRYLIVNEPELHYNGSTRILLDTVAGDAGMVPGNSYSLHVFHMERHTIESVFYIETDLVIHPLTCPRMCDNDAECKHGLCHTFEKKCYCQEGWAGDYCDQGLCWNVECGSNGNCNPYTGKCTCDTKWIGDQCEFRRCNYHGEGNVTCKCDPYFTGEDCQSCITHQNDDPYICQVTDDGIIIKTVHPHQFDNLIATGNFIRPNTEGLDCSCNKEIVVSNQADTSTQHYYDTRIDQLNSKQGAVAENFDVSSGDHLAPSFLVFVFIVVHLF